MSSCKKCIHYEGCLEAFRSSKAEGLYEDISEEEYFSHADDCRFFADKDHYRKQIEAEWIVRGDDLDRRAECSYCGKEYAVQKGMLQLQNFPHCPKCGAKMKGVDLK